MLPPDQRPAQPGFPDQSVNKAYYEPLRSKDQAVVKLRGILSMPEVAPVHVFQSIVDGYAVLSGENYEHMLDVGGEAYFNHPELGEVDLEYGTEDDLSEEVAMVHFGTGSDIYSFYRRPNEQIKVTKVGEADEEEIKLDEKMNRRIVGAVLKGLEDFTPNNP